MEERPETIICRRDLIRFVLPALEPPPRAPWR
jgi:hypothetical protein